MIEDNIFIIAYASVAISALLMVIKLEAVILSLADVSKVKMERNR